MKGKERNDRELWMYEDGGKITGGKRMPLPYISSDYSKLTWAHF